MNITNERAIAEQLFVENEFRSMIIPAHDSDNGNHISWYDIDGREYKLTLYNFSNERKPGFAKGLWLLVDRIVRGFKECEFGVRLV